MKYLAILALILFACAKKKPTVIVDTPDPKPEVVEKVLQFEKEVEPIAEEPPTPDYSNIPVIYFDYDKSDIREDQIHKMNQMLSLMGEANCRIEGHACEIGTEEYNMSLGEFRAASINEWLMAAGLSRFDIVSYGEERPATMDEDRLDLNRRVEVKCQ